MCKKAVSTEDCPSTQMRVIFKAGPFPERGLTFPDVREKSLSIFHSLAEAFYTEEKASLPACFALVFYPPFISIVILPCSKLMEVITWI